MSRQTGIVLLLIGGGAAVLLCAVLLRIFLSAPVLDEALKNASVVQPELRVRIRNSEEFTGAPIIVTVELHNLVARRVARGSDPTQARPDIPTIPLNGDWRLAVSFGLGRQDASGESQPLTMDTPIKLFAFQEPETILGVIALMDTWAVSPEESERLGSGQYTLHVQFEAEGLISDEYLPNVETLNASASFSLTPSSDPQGTAQMEETRALFYARQGESQCGSTVQHARSAFQMDPQRHMAYWYAANCLDATGDTPAAIATLEQLLAIFPPEAAQSDLYVAVTDRLDELQP
jgi:hypothetical protein